MKDSPQMLFAENKEDISSEDDIDELFGRLLQIEPPATLVDSILASVARLPLPQEMRPMSWADVKELLVHNEDQHPS